MMKLFQSSRSVVVKSFRALSQSLVIMTDAQLHNTLTAVYCDCVTLFFPSLDCREPLCPPPSTFRSRWGVYDTCERCAVWHELHPNDFRCGEKGGGDHTHTLSTRCIPSPPPSSPSFSYIYIFAHNDPRRVHFQIRPGSSAPRRQFYVVADPGLWSRCLGSDNIMTESAGVTRRHGRTNRHMQRHILYVAAAGWPWLFVRRRTMTSHNKGLVFCAYSCRWAPAAQNEKPPPGAAGSLSLANVTKQHIILLLLLLLWSLTLHCSS